MFKITYKSHRMFSHRNLHRMFSHRKLHIGCLIKITKHRKHTKVEHKIAIICT